MKFAPLWVFHKCTKTKQKMNQQAEKQNNILHTSLPLLQTKNDESRTDDSVVSLTIFVQSVLYKKKKCMYIIFKREREREKQLILGWE